MNQQQENLAQIKNLLKQNPQGMSVTEISRKTGKNMHSVGRYLDQLHLSGQVIMRTYGNAKVFSLARLVPLTQLFSHTTEMMMVLDQDRRVLQVNDPFLSLLSLGREEVIGKNLAFLPAPDPEAQDLVQALLASMDKGSTDVIFEISLGGERYLRARFIPILFDDGSQGSTVFLADETPIRLAEKALRESERKYRELVEKANSIILRMDLAGTVTFFNEYAERIFGFPREEIVGKSVIGTIVPRTESSGRDLEQMIARLLSHPEEFQDNLNENITKDGRRLWIHWSNQAIRDETGAPVGILSVGIDITKESQAFRALDISEAWYREMADYVPLPVFETDLQGSLTYSNGEAARVFGNGVSGTRPTGLFTGLIDPRDRDRAARNLALMVTNPASIKDEYMVLRGDGSSFPVLAFLAPIFREGKFVGIRNVFIPGSSKSGDEALSSASQADSRGKE